MLVRMLVVVRAVSASGLPAVCGSRTARAGVRVGRCGVWVWCGGGHVRACACGYAVGVMWLQPVCGRCTVRMGLSTITSVLHMLWLCTHPYHGCLVLVHLCVHFEYIRQECRLDFRRLVVGAAQIIH